MALEYDLNKRLARLLPVLDDYTEWFGQCMRRISHPESFKDSPNIKRPSSFYIWSAQARQDSFQPRILEHLNGIHDDLIERGEGLLLRTASTGTSAEAKHLDDFVIRFEEFVHAIRRLEKDILMGDRGIDFLTGLRSVALLDRDFKRELDRTARQGKAFSLALVRIPALAVLREAGHDDRANQCLKDVSGLIKKSVRSFDDGYRMTSDEILLSLKQANLSGGVRALERIKRALEHKTITFRINGEDHLVSLSSCIAEPVKGDNLETLLKNLRRDLDDMNGEEGGVLEYIELSPLQRYVTNILDV